MNPARKHTHQRIKDHVKRDKKNINVSMHYYGDNAKNTANSQVALIHQELMDLYGKTYNVSVHQAPHETDGIIEIDMKKKEKPVSSDDWRVVDSGW